MATIKKAQNGITKDLVKTKNDSTLNKRINKISDDFAKKKSEERTLKLYDNTNKKKMKNGGSLSALKASTKRVGATKMAKSGVKMSKKK